MEFDFDCFVIGGGSGGVRAAKLAAQAGKKVGLAEEYRFGGTCVIRGCVPKKLMLFASDFSQNFKDSVGFGWSAENIKFDWKKFLERKDKEIKRLEDIYLQGLINAGVKTFKAKAKISSDKRVILSSGDVISSENIIIATGGNPLSLNVNGSDLALTSNEIMNIGSLPKKLIIVGGGYIACEFANIFNGLGVNVTLLYRGSQILRGFDNEIATLVQATMLERGIHIKLGTEIGHIEKLNSGGEIGFKLFCSNGESLSGDHVLMAVGRSPNTKNLGLEDAGIITNSTGAIEIDDYQETNIKGVYAIGDVTNRINLTPVAIRDGIAVVKTIFGSLPTTPDHELVPSAVFTRPEIGTIGLTEEEALKSKKIQVFKTFFKPMYNALAERNEKYLMKMIVEDGSEKILGIHIAGEGASELIQIAAISVKRGATKSDFDRTVAVHPTLAEELVTLK
mgnify:FL=1